MKSAIWLSYDLGISGDYEGIYGWLDERHAKECGDSLAYISSYEWSGAIKEALKNDLAQAVEFNKNSRVYVIYTDENGRHGTFIVGRRKAPPWTGHGHREDQAAVDEA